MTKRLNTPALIPLFIALIGAMPAFAQGPPGGRA